VGLHWPWFWLYAISAERIRWPRKRHAAEKEQYYHLPHAMLLEIFVSHFMIVFISGRTPFSNQLPELN
jgi:hypothetical protein